MHANDDGVSCNVTVCNRNCSYIFCTGICAFSQPRWASFWPVEYAIRGRGRIRGLGFCADLFHCCICWHWVSSRVYGRSEEHTSELQSRGHLVCRLLLEK